VIGKCSSCLLAASFLILSSTAAIGQTELKVPAVRPAPAPEFLLPGPLPFQPPRIPRTPNDPVNPPVRIRFPVLVRSAGMVFSGTVKNIERRPATSGHAVETVAITFHIDNAIRGANAGEDLTISQWIGLWSSGQRYHVGERVLLFLYPPSKLGLTSCIAGPIGRFELDARGRVLLSAQHLAAFRTDPILGGKSRLSLSDFALAVGRASEEE